MRVLLSTTSGTGHFRPLLPLTRALTAAGHEVACAAPEEARDMVEKAGLRHLAFSGVPAEDEERGAVFSRVPTLSQTEAEHLICSEIFGRINTTYALPGASAAVQSFAPDVVVHDWAELGARLAAEQAGIRVVGANPGLGMPFFFHAVAEGTAGLRAELGLPVHSDGEGYLTSDQLSWFPAGFDVPDAAAGISRFRDGAPTTPSSLTDRELVYVTLGSEAAAMGFFAPTIRACVGGALKAGLPVVVSTGRDVDLSPLDGLEGDLTVRTWVDQEELLPRARVVVCHAGAGTMLGALQAGVPIVAVPLFADQPYNADRIAATGAGVRVSPGPDLEGGVAAAVQQLASAEPTASLDVARQIAALPPITDAIPWLATG